MNSNKHRRSEYGLYKRIVVGLENQPAYLLVFAVSALFIISGTFSTFKAVMNTDLNFGILGLLSFVCALIAVVVVVRQVENQASRHNDKLDRSQSAKDHPVITPNVGNRPEKLDDAEERRLLADLADWDIIETDDDSADGGVRRELHRIYEFKTFEGAFEFMQTSVERGIAQLDHHPRWQNTYNQIEMWLTTYNLGQQLSNRDSRLARILEQVWIELGRGR